MAGAHRGARTRGKSDPIDALAIARAALREGVENLPTARVAGPEREIRQLALYRERLLDMRTRLSNELRWQPHDLWPDWEIPAKALTQPGWQTKVANRLARVEQTIQVTIARDMIRRVRQLSQATKNLYNKIATVVGQVAPELLTEPGIGVLLAAKFIESIAGIPASLPTPNSPAWPAAPIPVSSGRSDRYRLDPGGNRRLHRPLLQTRDHPDPHRRTHRRLHHQQRANGKTKREASRCLKRHFVRRVYHLLHDPNTVPNTICLT
jgi:transposase